MFNTNAQCYQKKSQVLLTSAFILWPTCTRGFGIREKIRFGLRFFGVFLCGFAVFGPPLRPPHLNHAALLFALFPVVSLNFSNTLIINKENTKEILNIKMFDECLYIR